MSSNRGSRGGRNPWQRESVAVVNRTDPSCSLPAMCEDSFLFLLGLSPGLWDNFVEKGGTLQREILEFLLFMEMCA